MNIHLKVIFSIVSMIFFVSACQTAQTGEERKEASANAKRYELRGKVIAVDKEKKSATIDHEEIKGYMPRMTMDFPIKEEWALRELAPGATIQAEMVVDKEGYWLEKIAISKSLNESVGTPEDETPETKIGAEVPNFKLTKQDGKPFSFSDYKGKAVVLTFIYTRCPIPDYCILMSEHFAKLDAAIKADAELAKNARLLSISIEPKTDTPEVLSSYAQGHTGKDVKQDFAVWNLATGSEEEVRKTADFFGLKYMPENGQIVHSLRTALIAPDGKVYKMYRGNQWKPAEVLDDLRTIPAENFRNSAKK